MTDTRSRFIESLLEDEGLTDGLTDDNAAVVIDWCGKLAERTGNPPIPEDELKTRLQNILKNVKIVTKAVQVWERDHASNLVERHLARVWDQPELESIVMKLNTSVTTREALNWLLSKIEVKQC